MDATSSGGGPLSKKRSATTVYALSHEVFCIIFSFLGLLDLVRCSGVSKTWYTIISKSKLLQALYYKQQRNSPRLFDTSTSERSLKMLLQELAMNRHRLSLQEGHIDVFQWKGHSVRADQCRMKTGLILTGVGDKVMRLWSAENYNCLDEYSISDRGPLVDFDFDENKVVGLVGTRICIWRRNGKRNLFSSREGLFTKGLCMRQQHLFHCKCASLELLAKIKRWVNYTYLP